MHKILDILKALFCEIFGLTTILLLPFVVFFREPIGKESKIRYDGEIPEERIVVRTKLPDWLWWFQTPDEPLPGGLYEPTVRKWLLYFDDYWCSVLWLIRNRVYGLSWAFGKPASAYLDPVDGLVERDGLWRWQKFIGPFMLGAGWKVHRKDFDAHWETGPFWAIPYVTIRFRKT